MITQETYRCWVIGRLPGDTEPHFKTSKAARAELRKMREEDEDHVAGATVRRLGVPCWTVTCDGECGLTIDEDEDGVIHHVSAGGALRTAALWKWVLADHEHVFCGEDAPLNGYAVPLSPAEQEAAGQLVLPGVVP